MTQDARGGRRWITVSIELLVVAPTFVLFGPGAYVGLVSTVMLIAALGEEGVFDGPLQLSFLGLSIGAIVGLSGLAVAILLPVAQFRRSPRLRRATMVGLVVGLLSACVGLAFVASDRRSGRQDAADVVLAAGGAHGRWWSPPAPAGAGAA